MSFMVRMENYFNYFTEIEEHFWRKRGTAILLTTLDWALIDSWKQANIPIEAVLRGIDRTFEKYDQRKGKTRRVNGLAYCHQGVLEAAQEIERGELPHESAPPPFPHEALAAYLEKNTAAVNRFADKLTALGFLIVGDAQPTAFLPVKLIGDVGLWAAAVLTLITGWDYLTAGLKHMGDDPIEPPKADKRPIGPATPRRAG